MMFCVAFVTQYFDVIEVRSKVRMRVDWFYVVQF